MNTILLETAGAVATLTLNRPKASNAFNDAMISELREAVTSLDKSHRVVVIAAAGKNFCAGADLAWMKANLGLSEDEVAREAANLAGVFRTLDASPRVVIGRVQGAAHGGGLGLVACCDVVVAAEDATFAFAEVKRGLVPAIISPFVIRKIGPGWARRYFVTGETFGAQQAAHMGLVHEAVAAAELDAAVARITRSVLENGPTAVTEAKQLIRQILSRAPQEALEYGVQTIARLRTSAEGQEGTAAFLEGRAPEWV